MTPEDKAKYLVDKFNIPIMCNTRDIDEDDARLCAMICVDEIIEELLDIERTEHYTYERRKYWQEVKQQIQKR